MKKYLVHYRNLEFFVRLGMIIEKIHKVKSFEESFFRWKSILISVQQREHYQKQILKYHFKKVQQ